MVFKTDIEYIEMAIVASKRSRENGNHPFGSVLVNEHGDVVLEAENSFSEDGGPGHAETNLARAAAKKYSEAELAKCILVTSVEPCCMCAGNVYWSGIGTVVFGMTENRLLKLTGDNPENPTMDLPCRDVFKAGQKDIQVRGPFPELEQKILKCHEGFWD